MSVLVYASSTDGKFKKSAFEVVSYGKKVAEQLGTNVIAVTNNAEDAAEHYLNTAAKFPAYLKLYDFKPDYLTPHAEKLEKNKDATIRNLFDGTEEEFKKHVYENIKHLMEIRKNE